MGLGLGLGKSQCGNVVPTQLVRGSLENLVRVRELKSVLGSPKINEGSQVGLLLGKVTGSFGGIRTTLDSSLKVELTSVNRSRLKTLEANGSNALDLGTRFDKSFPLAEVYLVKYSANSRGEFQSYEEVERALGLKKQQAFLLLACCSVGNQRVYSGLRWQARRGTFVSKEEEYSALFTRVRKRHTEVLMSMLDFHCVGEDLHC